MQKLTLRGGIGDGIEIECNGVSYLGFIASESIHHSRSGEINIDLRIVADGRSAILSRRVSPKPPESRNHREIRIDE